MFSPTVSTLMIFLALGQLMSCAKSTGPYLGNPDIMAGVAAMGAPISNGKVEIKGSNGLTVEEQTRADGSYEANIAMLSEPYLIRVTSLSGEKFLSVAGQPSLAVGTKINVTPLTHMIAANVFGNADADSVFADFMTESADFSEEKLEEQKILLLEKFIAAGLVGEGKIAPLDIDLLSGELLAGTSIGLDGLLDVIDVNTSASAGIEVKLKGQSLPFITDKVDQPDPQTIVITSGQLLASKNQLLVLDQIRSRLNSLALAFSSKISCNSIPVDDGGPCDVDNLYALFLPFFHPAFQENGRTLDAGVWDWICSGDQQSAVTSRSTCLSAGQIRFEAVTLKDVGLINFDFQSNLALVKFNLYIRDSLKGMEELYFKLDSGNGLYKLSGNKKSFHYEVESETVFLTEFTKAQISTPESLLDSYNVNLRFRYEPSSTDTFVGNEVFTLNSLNGHPIFPGDSSTMSLYLVTAPVYDQTGQCGAGLVLSTRPDPYKVFNTNDGTQNYETFANACATGNNPCSCSNGSTWASFDFDAAEKISLTSDQVNTMDRIERVSLTGSGVTGDEFFIKKPLLGNSIQAAQIFPSIGMEASAFCQSSSVPATLNLSSVIGSLGQLDLRVSFHNSDNTVWNQETLVADYRNDHLSATTFMANFTVFNTSNVIDSKAVFVSSEDEFNRRFIRQIRCR